MNAVLLLFLASHLILPGAPQEQKTVAELVADLVENQEVLINKIYREADADKAQATKLANKVDHVLLDLDKAFAVIEILVELTNGTSQQNVLLQEDIEILKGRLAIAAIFSSVYMIISTLCLIGYLVVLVKKSVKKHQLKRHEEEVELMDQRLQERRERRRAAARAKSGSPRQQ